MANDQITFAGPAKIAATLTGEPLACASSCADEATATACVDQLFADGTCARLPDPTFPSFTALPLANRFQDLCETPLTPCSGVSDEVRFTIDTAGNVLIPVDWRGVLVDRDAVPVPRPLRATSTIESFQGTGAPILIPDQRSFLGSFSPAGAKIDPIFDPQFDVSDASATTLFGTADAPDSVLRIARRSTRFSSSQCLSGPRSGLPCLVGADCLGASCGSPECFEAGLPTGVPCSNDAECSSGECGPPLFDFAGRLEGGVGPILVKSNDLGQVDAFDPVPLDGLIQTEILNCFVTEEGIVDKDLNGDGDATDHIVTLGERATGTGRAIGEVVGGTRFPGRAIARIQSPPFSSPALAVEDDILAFLELEPDHFARDTNGNGRVFETILRVFRLGSDTPENLLPEGISAEAAPLIEGRSVHVENRRVFFRTPEAYLTPSFISRVSVASDGTEGDGPSHAPSMSDDGRIVVFESDASNLDLERPDANGQTDVFVHDVVTGSTRRISVPPGAGEANGPSFAPHVSGNGRVVSFHSDATNLDPARPGTGIFLHDLDTGSTERVAEAVIGGFRPFRVPVWPLSRDGNLLVFSSDADLDPTVVDYPLSKPFLYDRTARTFRRLGPEPSDPSTGELFGGDLQASIASDGGSAIFRATLPGSVGPYLLENLKTGSLEALPGRASSASGRFVVEDEGVDCVRLFDRATGASRCIGGATGRRISVSRDGRFASFVTLDEQLNREIRLQDLASGSTLVVGSTVEEPDEGPTTPAAMIAADGRSLAFESISPLVSDDTNEFCRHELASIVSCTAGSPRPGCSAIVDFTTCATSGETYDCGSYQCALECVLPPVVAGTCRCQEVIPHLNCADVYVVGPGALASSEELFADGAADDTVLQVLEVEGATVQTLCPAMEVSISGDVAAYLRPEAEEDGIPSAGCPKGSLNGDDDVDDLVAQLWRGGPASENLGVAATRLAVSENYVVATVSEAGEGEDANQDGDTDDGVVGIYAIGAGTWTMSTQAADAIGIVEPIVAFITPEVAQGGRDLNGDGDGDDRVLQVVDVLRDDAPVNLHTAAEEFVIGPSGIVAFRAREASQGRNLNAKGGDVDLADDVLQLWVPGSGVEPLNTGAAVTPCNLEACDPRIPYRVLDDTVRFLTFECDQGGPVTAGCPAGGTDLNGDGDAGDLVYQVLNVERVMHGAMMEDACHALASISAGVCTDSGKACATDRDCMAGTCFVPPGGCIRDLDTSCDPLGIDEEECGPGAFCQPTGGGGVCRRLELTCRGGPRDGEECVQDAECPGGECSARCRNDVDCPLSATCNEAQQEINRLADPFAENAPAGSGVVFVGSGRCIEDVGTACVANDECASDEFCDGGTCARRLAACKTDEDCGAEASCEPELIAQTAADSDDDELPDVIDNCPQVANIMQQDLDQDGVGDACDPQTCGNGTVEAGEPCDDGNLVVGDGCDCTVQLCSVTDNVRRPRVSISRLGGKPNDAIVRFSGRLTLPAAAANLALEEIVGKGAQVVIEDLGAGGRAILDLSRRTAPVPPQAAGGCAAGDGWTLQPSSGRFVYKNRSNALPGASCVPGSAQGLVQLTVRDRRNRNGTIDFVARFRNAPIDGVVGPLRATLVLGRDGVSSLAGECGAQEFDRGRCKLGSSHSMLVCR